MEVGKVTADGKVESPCSVAIRMADTATEVDRAHTPRSFMAEQSPSPHPQRAASSSVEPDAVLDRLATLADRGPAEEEFYPELLRELVDATAALGAAVWTCDGDQIQLAAQHGLSYCSEPSPNWRNLMKEVLASGRTQTVPATAGPADAVAILCVCQLPGAGRGVLELRQSSRISEDALAGQVRFLAVAADLVAVWRRNRQLAGLGQRDQQWRRIDAFAQTVHRLTDLETIAYEIAAEGRTLLQCDRLSVIVRRRGRWTAMAVSGCDRVNRRSPVVACLERLAAIAAAGGAAVHSGKDREELPPELEQPLDDYHDLASARFVALAPLSLEAASEEEDAAAVAGPPFAVLVVEQFSQDGCDSPREVWETVSQHSASALNHALRFEQMPLRRIGLLLERSRWANWFRERPWSVGFATLLAILLLAAAVIPAELRVEADGTLQPRVRRHLFAPADGVVEQLLVEDAGQEVVAGQELLRLQDSELQYEIESVLGELETARKQLAALEAERLRSDRTSRSDLREATQRSGEEEALKKRTEGLVRQQTLLDERREKLSVRSPMKGRLLTWNAEELLQSRPVARGQILLTVADLDGEWIVEVEIPDDRASDVVDALRSEERPLAAHFILATAPENRYSGNVEWISPATDVRAGAMPTVAAVVVPENQVAMRALRPGASVVMKIDCGRRSLLNVWSRGLVRAIKALGWRL